MKKEQRELFTDFPTRHCSTFRQRPHRSFLVQLFPAAVAAQLLDGLAGNLAAGFLIEF
jgi:hypothetical protein